jgi:hypothetical protein
MTEQNRRAGDELLVRLDGKVDQILERFCEHSEWLRSHETRIQECEQQHMRIKTIIAMAGGALALLWTGILYFLTGKK